MSLSCCDAQWSCSFLSLPTMEIVTLSRRRSQPLVLSVPSVNEPRPYFAAFQLYLFCCTSLPNQASTIIFKWLSNCIIRRYFKEICHAFCEASHDFYYSGGFEKRGCCLCGFFVLTLPRKGNDCHFHNTRSWKRCGMSEPDFHRK